MSNECWAYVAAIDSLGEAEGVSARYVLAVIATNTFNDTFVCRTCQEQLAYEAGRMSTRNLRRLLDSLEAARIIIRQRRRSEHGYALNDVIRVVGFKRWYLAGHGSARRTWREAEAKTARKKPADKLSGGGTSRERAAGSQRTSCPVVEAPATGQQCPVTTGHTVSGGYKDSLSRLPSQSLPQPPSPEAIPGEGKGKPGFEGQGQRIAIDPIDATIPPSRRPLLAALRADGMHAAIVEHLIRPMLPMLAVPPGKDGPTYVRTLRDMAAEAGDMPEAALTRAAKRFVAERTRDLPWPKDVGPALAEAKAALMVKLTAGDPRWAAWLAHDRADPAKSVYAAHVQRSRSDYAAMAFWPPDSPEVEQVAGKFYIPHGTPEHAAWLAHWRRQGRHGIDKAQSLDVAKARLNMDSRWPDFSGGLRMPVASETRASGTTASGRVDTAGAGQTPDPEVRA